jgi:hypothetical protein
MMDAMIERRSKLSYDDFRRDYIEPRRPVIVTDAMDQWRARHHWTPAYFKERFGPRVVETDDGWTTVSEFVDRLNDRQSTKIPFIREQPIEWVLPELMNDLQPMPPYHHPNWLNVPWPKLGSRGYAHRMKRLAQTDLNFTGAGKNFPVLHIDRFRSHALIFQVLGDKVFYSYPPSETPYLYTNGGDVSAITDVENPNLAKYPLFERARQLKFELRAGEMLFNPSGWWHTTKTLQTSISVVISFANVSNWLELVGDMCRLEHRRVPLFLPYASMLLAFGGLHKARDWLSRQRSMRASGLSSQ